MSIPTVTPEQLIERLHLARATKRPLMLRGGPGVGKSSIFQQFAEECGLEYEDFRAIYYDPTDVKGFPTLDKDQGVSRWLPPAQFPRGGSGMIVIEELVSAAPLVQAALYQLMLDRRVGDYVLPDGWFIVATGNRIQDRGIVNKMPSPLVSRMWHLELVVSNDDWARYAIRKGIHPALIGFFRFRPELLNSFDPTNWKQDTPYTCPRVVEMLSELMQSWEQLYPAKKLPADIPISCLGEGVGLEFFSFLDIYRSMPSIDQILTDPTNAPLPDRPAVNYAVSAALAQRTTPKNADRVLTYLRRLEKEFEVMAVRSVFAADPNLCNTPAFAEWAVDNTAVLS